MKSLTTQIDNLINLLIRFNNYLKINYVKQDMKKLRELFNETQTNN